MDLQMTQKKILDVSRKLFAEKGFEGTSIRDIAKEAEVNVASVNYHFKSKENLYSHIIQEGCHELSKRSSQIYEEHKQSKESIEEFFVKMFRDFLSHEDDIVSNMKMLMSVGHSPDLVFESSHADEFGPPGGSVIALAIREHLNRDLSLKELHWAVKSIFAHMVHLTIVNKCVFKTCKKSEVKDPFSDIEDLEYGIRKLSRLIISSL